MNSATTAKFRQGLAELPMETQRRARKAYRLWRQNPRHSSLHFKKVGKVWSARIDDNYRVLAHIIGDTAYWFWIGSHAEYERLIALHRKG
jgi:hypothetical protein